MTVDETYLERAAEFIGSAQDDVDHDPPRLYSAFKNALDAAELSAKALLIRAVGSHPREHQLAGVLAFHGLIPVTVPERALKKLFDDYFAPRYGTRFDLDRERAADAVRMAKALLAAAREWPSGKFHPARAPQ